MESGIIAAYLNYDPDTLPYVFDTETGNKQEHKHT